ncbi:hypothetical protein KC338_g52 [Hortaea werneckii]|nr:hypothetical protein KC338_g52 [Hortaea werneckii]
MIAARVPWPPSYSTTQAHEWPLARTMRISLESSSTDKISQQCPKSTKWAAVRLKLFLCFFMHIYQKSPPDHAHHCCVHLRTISSFTGCICATVWLILESASLSAGFCSISAGDDSVFFSSSNQSPKETVRIAFPLCFWSDSRTAGTSSGHEVLASPSAPSRRGSGSRGLEEPRP